jgi:hypothetical protein
MSRKRWMGTIGAVVCFALSLAAETARAESFVPPDATYDASVCMHPPPLDAVTPASGTVIPANQPHILVPYGVYRLIERASGDEIPTEIRTDVRGYRLALLGPLTEGSEIALQVSVCEGLEGIVATWTVGPAVPVATSLGTLSLSEVRAYYPSLHSEELAYFVSVTLVPDPALAPWQREYVWWLAGGSMSTSLDMPLPAHVGCREPVGRAWPQGMGGAVAFSVELSTPSGEVLVDCTDPPLHESFGGRALTAREIEELLRARAAAAEAGMAMDMDAFVATPDAGPASIDGGMAAMPTEPDTNGHCAVSAPGRGGRWAPLLLLGVAIALRTVRRRR